MFVSVIWGWKGTPVKQQMFVNLLFSTKYCGVTHAPLSGDHFIVDQLKMCAVQARRQDGITGGLFNPTEGVPLDLVTDLVPSAPFTYLLLLYNIACLIRLSIVTRAATCHRYTRLPVTAKCV